LTEAADLIVLGGVLHTVDEANESARAFAVRDERFCFVGSADGALALCGPSTELIDADGLTVLPGLIDAHLHLTNLGLTLDQVDLRGVASVEELIERTKAFAGARDGWIFGRGWDDSRWPGREFPSHWGLSAAIGDRPVVVTRVDGHALLANARAMAIAGIDSSSLDPPGGRIVRDAGGNPTGIFIDSAESLIYDKAPKPSHDELVRAIRAAIAECNRWGVTTVCEPGCDDDMLAAHADLAERGDHSIRNYAMLNDEPALIARHARRGIVNGAYGGRLWVRAIKMYADGALGSRGAALLAPYSDDPQNCGLVLASRERIERGAEDAIRTGFQLGVHAIGDRGNRNVLDAFEAALKRLHPTDDPRLRIEHAQVLAPDDAPRFGKLGIIASMQAMHAVSDGAWVQARLGRDRAAGAYAWRALLDSGATIANGTDAPVESPSSVGTFLASVMRGGREPEQCMTRREALASMTIDAARAAFAEHLVGSIATGKYADFVIMDRDWMRVPVDAIDATTIVATYFGGRRVYG
jgi:predicted amidohydrolase YtcJ